MLAGEVSWFAVSGDGARLVIGDDGDVRVVPSDRKADNGSSDDVVTVDLTRARFQADPAALWRHAYAEFGRLLRRDFWTPTMSDVDWDGVLDEYRFLLDRVRTSAEFGDLLWEVGGRARHVARLRHAVRHVLRPVGAARPARRAARRRRGPRRRTGAGSWSGCCRASRPTRGPARRSPPPGWPSGEGDEILAVDGRPLDPVHGPWPALAGTARQAGRADDQARRPVPGPASAGRAGGRGRGLADARTPRTPRPPKRRGSEAAESAAAAEDRSWQAAGCRLTATGSDDAPGPPTTRGDAPRRRGRPPLAQAHELETRRVVVVPLYDDRRLRYQDWVAGRRQFVRDQVRRPGRLPARARHDGGGLGAPAPRPARRDGPRGADRRRARQPRRAHLAAHRREARPPDHRLEDPAAACAPTATRRRRRAARWSRWPTSSPARTATS